MFEEFRMLARAVLIAQDDPIRAVPPYRQPMARREPIRLFSAVVVKDYQTGFHMRN
jgi:hypothetical protein